MLSRSNPKFVESFLRETVEIEVDVSYNDLLCFSCYKYCNRLLKSGLLMNIHMEIFSKCFMVIVPLNYLPV